jgi:hypothetical protein
MFLSFSGIKMLFFGLKIPFFTESESESDSRIWSNLSVEKIRPQFQN